LVEGIIEIAALARSIDEDVVELVKRFRRRRWAALVDLGRGL
jgi:hypothetical protein